MAGVERLMVVKHPLASNPEDTAGSTNIVQQAADFLHSYGVTPEAAAVSAGVGLILEPGLRGMIKGALAGSLLSLLYNNLAHR